MISLLHRNKKLGQFSAEQISDLLAKGQVDTSFYYWMPGMGEWRPFTPAILKPGFSPETSRRQKVASREHSKVRKRPRDPDAPLSRHLAFLGRRSIPTSSLTRKTAAELVEATKKDEARRAKLATAWQKAYLEYHGVECEPELTKEQASALVVETGAKFPYSRWLLERHLRYPALYSKPVFVPITEKQHTFLRLHGVPCSKRMSKIEASILIQRTMDDPNRDSTKWNEHSGGSHECKISE